MGAECAYNRRGFTLIELSIVLVIIGLIVGGVLVGQSLINAAAIRAQVTQIEKYNTAANTFREKYGYLPGDIPAGPAAEFGFAARGTLRGEGDGNGVIETYFSGGGVSNFGIGAAVGETIMFWADLSKVKLIDGGFTAASSTVPVAAVVPSYLTEPLTIGSFFPTAKIGNGLYLYVWSGGIDGGNGSNYFGLSAVTLIDSGMGLHSSPGLTVNQAYLIDSKVDDGLPQLGRVTSLYANGENGNDGIVVWAAGGGGNGSSPGATASGSSTTCYDNGGNSSNPMQYSVEISNGSNVNCALSFQMQAGD